MPLSLVAVVVLQSCLVTVQCSLHSILDDKATTRLSLTKCVGEATDRFFNNNEVILVSLSTFDNLETSSSTIATDAYLFSELFRRSNFSVIIKKTTKKNIQEHYIKIVDNYVIQIRNEVEIDNYLQTLPTYATWNSYAKFMIISASNFPNPQGIAVKIIEQLWQKKITSGVVLLSDPEDVNLYYVYSWQPFSSNLCTDGFNEVKIIDTCRFGRFDNGKNWFAGKIPHNLHGCPIRVHAIVWPPYVLSPGIHNGIQSFAHGLEIMILNTMSEVSNFSIIYSTPNKTQDWGSVYQNGTITGGLLRLKNEEYDIIIGSFAATVERHTYFDYVIYDIPESLTWCVPHAQDTNQWQKLLLVVSLDVWFFCIVLVFIVGICLWTLSRTHFEESMTYKNLPSSMQNSFSVLVNMAVKRQPKTSMVRILFLLWTYFGMHFAVIYQSTLISVLAKPNYDQRIKDIEDILLSNMRLQLMYNARKYFIDESDTISQKILKRWNDCDDIEMCLNDTAFERNSVTCTPRLYMKYAVNHYLTTAGEPLLYCFKNSIVTYPLEMVLVKGFPLKEYFDLLVDRFTAAGLIAHWEKQIFDYQSRKFIPSKSEDGDKLTVVDLELIFIILLTGNIVAFVTFIVEFRVHKNTINAKDSF